MNIKSERHSICDFRTQSSLDCKGCEYEYQCTMEEIIDMAFHISQKEHDQIWEWERNHDCPISYEGAVGGKLTYMFTPTSIGTVFKIKCACGLEHDLTDYEDW